MYLLVANLLETSTFYYSNIFLGGRGEGQLNRILGARVPVVEWKSIVRLHTARVRDFDF